MNSRSGVDLLLRFFLFVSTDRRSPFFCAYRPLKTLPRSPDSSHSPPPLLPPPSRSTPHLSSAHLTTTILLISHHLYLSSATCCLLPASRCAIDLDLSCFFFFLSFLSAFSSFSVFVCSLTNNYLRRSSVHRNALPLHLFLHYYLPPSPSPRFRLLLALNAGFELHPSHVSPIYSACRPSLLFSSRLVSSSVCFVRVF